MTHDEKIGYMKIAANVCGFGVEHKHIDMLVGVYELVLEKKGKSNIEDALNIKQAAENRQAAKERQKILDKISEKVA